MKELDSMVRRNYADLAQKVHAASWQSQLPLQGSIVTVPVKGRKYYYWQSGARNAQNKRPRFYIGPTDDTQIQEQVDLFKREKTAFQTRRRLVRMLASAGLPQPDRRDGEIVAAIERAGFFRLRGVLVGSLAYQTYAGLLGVQLPESTMQTEDADFAQFHSISVAINERTDALAKRLKQVDPSLREVPHHSDPRTFTKLQADDGYQIELLTPNYSKDDYQNNPPQMPALEGMSALPLRHLDFLIYEASSAMLLHKGGIAVNVPQPQRYAVHKLLIGPQRGDDVIGRMKADKDLTQAANLIEAMSLHDRFDLGEAWMEAWNRGPSWRYKLEVGKARLSHNHRGQLDAAIREACVEYGEGPETYGVNSQDNPTDELNENQNEPSGPGGI